MVKAVIIIILNALPGGDLVPNGTNAETMVEAPPSESMSIQTESEPVAFAWASFKRGLTSIHTLILWGLKSIAYRIGFWVGAGVLAFVFAIPYSLLEPQSAAVKTVVAILFTLLVLTSYGALRIKYDSTKQTEEEPKPVE